MEDKDKEVIVDEEKKEEVETPTVETPIIETEPDMYMKILEAIADLKGDVANLIQKSEAIESPLEDPPTEETPPEENSEETPQEEDTTEISEEEQEDISDMFKD